MSTKSSNLNYGLVAVTIHWLSAMFIIELMISGSTAADTVDLTTKAQLLSVHAPVGITILLLTLCRIIWWWRFDEKPAVVGNDPRWQTLSAKVVHVAFYIVIIGMSASGIGMFLLSDAGPIVFGFTEGVLPDFHDYLPRVPHGAGAKVMVALLIMHSGAALYHHFIKRDMTLRRMWFNR